MTDIITFLIMMESLQMVYDDGDWPVVYRSAKCLAYSFLCMSAFIIIIIYSNFNAGKDTSLSSSLGMHKIIFM